MSDRVELHPTKTRLALLADVDALKVADDEDGVPTLDLGADGTARVADAIRQMERAGWIWQPADTRGYRLTDLGRAVHEAGAR